MNSTINVTSSCSDNAPTISAPCPLETKNICTDNGFGNPKAFMFFFGDLCIIIPIPFQVIKVKRLLYKHGMTVNQAITTIQQMLS